MDSLIDQMEHVSMTLHRVLEDFRQLNDAQQGIHRLAASAMKDPLFHEGLDWNEVVSLFELLDGQGVVLIHRLEALAAQFHTVPADVSTDKGNVRDTCRKWSQAISIIKTTP
jgi:hypothetical protein